MLSYIYSSLKAALEPLLTGSKLRHWPPGTNSSTVRAVFFCADEIDPPAPIPHGSPSCDAIQPGSAGNRVAPNRQPGSAGNREPRDAGVLAGCREGLLALTE